jgi:glycerol-3-phosphate dehydrogenase (NAD(P)+)
VTHESIDQAPGVNLQPIDPKGSLRVAVIGAGSWGTTVASLSAANSDCQTILWARDESLVHEINSAHTNKKYLPGFTLCSALKATTQLHVALVDVDLVVMGVPSHGFRTVLANVARFVAPHVPIVSLTKGVEQGTHLRMTEVIAELLPKNPCGVLSGPNLAKEVMAGHPAATVVAIAQPIHAQTVQRALGSQVFRVYSNTDVIGAEISGSLKNILAIGAGMVDGMGFGDNTKATFITRGLNEIARLGTAVGGRILTFGGLAGLGDLIATCSSPQSRNRTVGVQLGRGRKISEVIAEMNMVAEGVKSCAPVHELAMLHGLELPIVEQVKRVVCDDVSAADALAALLARPTTTELDF